jgi:fucose permease
VFLLAALAAGGRGAWPLLRRADLLGAVLLGGALGCVVLTFAASEPATEVVGPLGYALLPVAVLLCVGYAVHHRRAASPLVPRGLVRGRLVWALVVSLLVGVALVAVVVDVPLLARIVHTSSQTEAALVLVRFLVAVPLGALAGGWALRRLGNGVVAAGGLALAAVGLAVMTTWGRGSLDQWSATAVLALTGLGIGLALAPVNDAALAQSHHDTHGTASALVVVARMVGMVVGVALLTAIGLHQYYAVVSTLPDPTDTAALKDAAVLQVAWVFRGAAVAAGLGALASLALGLHRRTGEHATTLGL